MLAIPFNRSLVLGPHEIRGINIPCMFLEGGIQQILGALVNRKVVFLWKTNGRNIWGALKNYSAKPQQILPWHALVLVNTGAGFFKVLDNPIMGILDKRHGKEFLRKIEGDTREGWLNRMKSKYQSLFADSLGTCKTYVVKSILFKHEFPWKW